VPRTAVAAVAEQRVLLGANDNGNRFRWASFVRSEKPPQRGVSKDRREKIDSLSRRR
jgi:hypothetical protein